MRLGQRPDDSPPRYRKPLPTRLPEFDDVEIGAAYHRPRMGGDCYEFLSEGTRLIFMMLDVAGGRERALHIAAGMQDTFRHEVPRLFAQRDLNESDSISELSLLLNRKLIAAAGQPQVCPAFVACYSREVGALAYVNAGYTPGLLRDAQGITQLGPTGLAFGLFSHSTYEAQVRVLSAGASLLLASRGVVESRRGREMLGMAGLEKALASSEITSAQQLCRHMLCSAQEFARGPLLHDDATAIALVRAAASRSATA